MSEEKTLKDLIDENCDGITEICKTTQSPCTCTFVVNIRQYAKELWRCATGAESERDELKCEINLLNGRLHGSRDGRKAIEKLYKEIKARLDEVLQQRETLFRHNFEEVQRREKLEAEVRELEKKIVGHAAPHPPETLYTRAGPVTVTGEVARLETEVRELNANLAAVAEIMEPDKGCSQDALNTWAERARAAEKEVARLEGANETLRAQLDTSRKCRKDAQDKLKRVEKTCAGYHDRLMFKYCEADDKLTRIGYLKDRLKRAEAEVQRLLPFEERQKIRDTWMEMMHAARKGV